jgi:hypothetical protein
VPAPVLPVNCVTLHVKFVQLSCTDPLWTDVQVPASAALAPPLGPVVVWLYDEQPAATNPATTAASTVRFMACNSRLNIVSQMVPRQTSI